MRVSVPPTSEEQARAAREAAERAKPPYCVVTMTVKLEGDRTTTKSFGYRTLTDAQNNAHEGLRDVFETALVSELELKLGLQDKAVAAWLKQPTPGEKEQQRMFDDLREIALADLSGPTSPAHCLTSEPTVDDAKGPQS